MLNQLIEKKVKEILLEQKPNNKKQKDWLYVNGKLYVRNDIQPINPSTIIKPQSIKLGSSESPFTLYKEEMEIIGHQKVKDDVKMFSGLWRNTIPSTKKKIHNQLFIHICFKGNEYFIRELIKYCKERLKNGRHKIVPKYDQIWREVFIGHIVKETKDMTSCMGGVKWDNTFSPIKVIYDEMDVQ